MTRTFIIRLVLTVCLIMGAGSMQQEKEPWCGDALYKIGIEDEMSRKIGADQTFAVEAESNPSTGYSWKVILPDSNALVMEKVEYLAPAPGERVGVPGKQHWCFRALLPGEWKIEFIYIRPWEKDPPPARRVLLTVKVE